VTLEQPGAADDVGGADAELTAALARYAETGEENPVLALLSSIRLLVPVKAVAADVVEGDHTADISAVLMRGRDGRLALLAFSGLDQLRRWDREARPVPLSGAAAAQAALAQGARALLVDLAGPVTFVVETAELSELAAGHELRPTSVGYAWFAVG
jgi:type III secretion system (T3SS) SseB-like protein